MLSSFSTRTWCSSPNGVGRYSTQRLEEIFRDVCKDFEVELREFNGEKDHVHLLVNDPPKVRLSALVNSLKGVSSRRMKQEFPGIATFWSVLEKQGASLVTKLFRRVRWRSADHDSPPVHRAPESAFGRCPLNPGASMPGHVGLFGRPETTPVKRVAQSPQSNHFCNTA
jgi:hypothetical protein